MKLRGAFLVLVGCTSPVYETTLYESRVGIPAEEPMGLYVDDAGPDVKKVKRGWQQSGLLTTCDSIKNVSMQANFEDEPGFYTVQFAVIKRPSTPTNPIVPFAAIADINWSVEGNIVKRQVNINDGISVSGAGQGVTVTMSDHSEHFLGSSLAGIDYVIGVQITKGVRPGTANPPTLMSDLIASSPPLAPLASVIALVPEGAGVTSVQVTVKPVVFGDLPVAGVLVEHRNTIINVKAYTSDSEPGFVPIAPTTTYVSITNLNPASAYIVSLTWGIDG